VELGADRDHRRVPAVRLDIPQPGLGRGGGLVGHQQGDRRDLRRDEADQGRDHRRGAAAGARAPAAGRPHRGHRPARPVRRPPPDHRRRRAGAGGGVRRAGPAAHAGQQGARCAKASCTTCWAAAAPTIRARSRWRP
jgi:hypothetical protein